MRRLLNTLYVTSEDSYLALDGENVVVRQGEQERARYPLSSLESIICFSYAGASPALMGACVGHQINLCFFSPRGRFLARAGGEISGNVLLRRSQYRLADDADASCCLARNMIFGKVYNARWSIDRTKRDHGLQVDSQRLEQTTVFLQEKLPQILQASDLDTLRGLEGITAAAYFQTLDTMILHNKQDFFFHSRSRRPPMDRVNCLLSLVYALLAADCAAALQGVGLDPYVGFLHQDRPGRISLALDLMEELRPAVADRFVLTLINNRIVKADDFRQQESGAVLMNDDSRKRLLKAWQERKRESITHPYIKEKMLWGLVPHIQSLLLARTLRGDLDAYPPFLWK